MTNVCTCKVYLHAHFSYHLNMSHCVKEKSGVLLQIYYVPNIASINVAFFSLFGDSGQEHLVAL